MGFFEAFKNLVHKYCDDTTIHGLQELYYARTKVTRALWVVTMVVGFAMTVFQIRQVTVDFNASPTKTQITLLTKKDPLKYPPFLLRYKYFVDWVDLKLASEMGFDRDSFLYAMSYFYPVFTPTHVNVANANAKLQSIMVKHSIRDLYDLAMAISLPTPANIVSNESFYRIIDYAGRFHYLTKMEKNFYENEFYIQFTEHQLTMITYADFQTTQFARDFATYFKSSFIEEYKMFKRFLLGDSANNESMITSIPFSFNSVGLRNTYGDIDIYINDYEFYVSGTLYKWIPVPSKPCIETDDAPFYVECLLRCASTYRLFKLSECKLYLLNVNSSYDDLANSKSQCDFDAQVVNSSNLYYPKDAYDNCIQHCLSGCTQWNYKFNQILYPRELSQENNGHIKGTIILTYDEQENILVVTLQPSWMWYEVLANIGGLLGLWLGGSIISFIQFLYAFCWIPLETWAIEWKLKKNNKDLIFRKAFTPNSITSSSLNVIEVKSPPPVSEYDNHSIFQSNFVTQTEIKPTVIEYPKENNNYQSAFNGPTNSSSLKNKNEFEQLKLDMKRMDVTLTAIIEKLNKIRVPKRDSEDYGSRDRDEYRNYQRNEDRRMHNTYKRNDERQNSPRYHRY